MHIHKVIESEAKKAIEKLYSIIPDDNMIQVQETRKDFEGDLTLVVFPILRISKKAPEQTANELGQYLVDTVSSVSEYNVIKGFLNLTISTEYWFDFFTRTLGEKTLATGIERPDKKSVMVEYSSPNTNKPLHLGHIRNILLGHSISTILKACGHDVTKVNLVNDRGIHICKSMIAWQKWGNDLTPEKAEKKGDHLVGDFYVKFDQEYKKEITQLVASGVSEDEAKKAAPLLKEAQEMLVKWEQQDPETIALWEKMNGWVLKGFDITYERLGVDFDKTYFESNTYKSGKQIILDGVEKGVFKQKNDQSVWADLTDKGLDEKILLRSDGTSVYMTQDIGTATQRFSEFHLDQHVYVVGNEQNYHFQVLKHVLNKLGYPWADDLCHLSYGMVELPEGKMKSREGTVVDADDLIDEMITTAREMSDELGKLEGYTEEEKENIFKIIGLGALKYFILKVDPKKNMTFNPKESVDFNGNTGPFIQYSYARIQSILRKAHEKGVSWDQEVNVLPDFSSKEKEIIKIVHRFGSVVNEAANTLSPAILANYVFDLAKEFNQFYHDHPMLNEENEKIRCFRIQLSDVVGNVIKESMSLLGIKVPERM